MGNGGSRGRTRSEPRYQITSTARATAGVYYEPPKHAGIPHPREVLQTLFGRPVSHAEITALVGATPGAEMHVSSIGKQIVQVVVQGPPGHGRNGVEVPSAYRADRYIMHDHETGRPYIFNENFFPDPRMARQGLGVQMLATQVRAASRMGVAYLYTKTGRNDTATADTPYMNGYYRWPLLGYDMKWSDVAARLRGLQPPATLGQLGHLSDLMSTSAGRAWWQEHGTTLPLTFDLTPGSRSRQILNTYLATHGHPTV